MAFPEEVEEYVWGLSDGKCECRRISHKHPDLRCGRKLAWENRGKDRDGGWEAHHINSTGGDDMSNCEILCWECYRKVT